MGAAANLRHTGQSRSPENRLIGAKVIAQPGGDGARFKQGPGARRRHGPHDNHAIFTPDVMRLPDGKGGQRALRHVCQLPKVLPQGPSWHSGFRGPAGDPPPAPMAGPNRDHAISRTSITTRSPLSAGPAITSPICRSGFAAAIEARSSHKIERFMPLTQASGGAP